MIRAITLRRLTVGLVVILPFAAFLYAPSPGFATPLLGTAGDFAILAGTAVTNTGSTTISGSGNVGVTPGSSIDGGITFGTGTTHSADAVAGKARNDAFTGVAPISAFNFLANLTTLNNLSGQVLGTGGTIPSLSPGIYHFDTTAQLTGALTLDNGGNNNAVFVFQIGSSLTTASGSSVSLIGAGTGDGVFWQVVESATLGTTTAFTGNILAGTAITLNNSATILCGSALARSAAVSMSSNTIGAGCGGGYQSVGNSFELMGPGGGGAAVPEPSSLLLLTAGLIGVAGRMRRARAVRP